jgi:hypothetical protein
MPSPFPGMDPYLEDDNLWPPFHHHLISSLLENLRSGLNARYEARVGHRLYSTGQGPSHLGTTGEHHEEFLEIHQGDEGKLVTLMDVLSPANKRTSIGCQAYLKQRRLGRESGTSLVEIDLLLEGQPTLEYSREGLPPWDYAVTVTRATHPDRHEIYTATLQNRLPRFRLPLSGDDADKVVDLQSAFSRCYEHGAFADRIDYRLDPPVKLSDDNRRWLDRRLMEQGLRQRLTPGLWESTLPHEVIARAAYYLWQAEGCPNGRDREHWSRAIDQLLQIRRPDPAGR